MTDDPMLIKAEALEKELLEACDASKSSVRRGVVATRLMNRAALLIQQMRGRIKALEGEEQ